MPEKNILDAQELMIANLDNVQIPLSLLSQYMPIQYTNVREGRVLLDARELLKDRIKNCIDEYLYAILKLSLL